MNFLKDRIAPFFPSPTAVKTGATRTPYDPTFGTEKIAISDFFFNEFNFDGKDWVKPKGYYLRIYDATSPTSKYVELALPIAPQNITIDVPSATNLAVTMKGIVEEHNGAPLRRIMIRGTSGVLNSNGDDQNPNLKANAIFDTVFKNTITSINRVANQTNNLISSIKGVRRTTNFAPSDSTVIPRTGYYFIHRLQNFLDKYLAMKKQRRYKNVRLQLIMEKDKMYYDCSLSSYNIRKGQGTLEYEYDLNLTAWRRSKDVAADKVAAKRLPSSAKDLNAFSKALSALRNSRKLINSAVGILQGIRSDIDQSLLTPLREIMLFGGEAVGAGNTLMDFPNSTIRSVKFHVEQSVTAAKAATIKGDKMSSMGSSLSEEGLYASSATPSQTNYRSEDILDSVANENEGKTSTSESGSPMDTVFNNPTNYLNFFDNFATTDLNLGESEQNLINNEISRVNALSINDLKQRRDLISDYISSVSQGLGGSHPTQSRVYNSPSKKTYKKLTTDDITLLDALNDVLIQTDSTIAFLKSNGTDSSNDYYSYYATLARANDIQFQDASSKFFVPFPYGASLQSLAVQYLGNADRWIEIAAINGLRPPYIDEDGFEILFKGSGSGLSAVLPSSDNLYIGQPVEIISDTMPTLLKKIVEIDVLNSVEVLVSFDGETQINDYIVADNARLKAFMPDTVNSSRLIAIPSQGAVSETNKVKTNPSKDDLDYLSSLAKIDFLLNQSGDVVVSSSGDIGVATGLQNLVQAANLKLQTKMGTIISDPAFGNPANAGVNIADLSASEVLNRINVLFADDERFGPILAANVRASGPALNMDLAISLPETDYTLPLSVQVPL